MISMSGFSSSSSSTSSTKLDKTVPAEYKPWTGSIEDNEELIEIPEGESVDFGPEDSEEEVEEEENPDFETIEGLEGLAEIDQAFEDLLAPIPE